jgi:branched-chain amino acid transport system ATP-binding protein
MIEKTKKVFLETTHLSKYFGGLKAVDHVSIVINQGGLHSLIGPNGAGKTTFLNLISGVYKPTEGKVYYQGDNITDLPAHRRAHMGIGRSYQITNIFPTLTVLENVRIAAQALGRENIFLLSDYTSFPDYIDRAMQALDKVGLGERAPELALTLNHGDKRRLEVAMLLVQDLELLLLDEPTAGLGTDQVPEFMQIIQSISKNTSKTIVLVEHNMNVVMNLSDRIYVMHQGQLIAEGSPDEISANKVVQEAYLGGLYSDVLEVSGKRNE